MGGLFLSFTRLLLCVVTSWSCEPFQIQWYLQDEREKEGEQLSTEGPRPIIESIRRINPWAEMNSQFINSDVSVVTRWITASPFFCLSPSRICTSEWDGGFNTMTALMCRLKMEIKKRRRNLESSAVRTRAETCSQHKHSLWRFLVHEQRKKEVSLENKKSERDA